MELRPKKFLRAYVYLPQSGARGLEILIWLKNYTVQKRQNTFL